MAASSIRRRFIISMAVLTTVITLLYGYAMHIVVEQMEYQLVERNLRDAMEELRSVHAQGGQPVPHTRSGVNRYVVTEQSLDSLPGKLAMLPPGAHTDRRIDGERVHVLREDVGNTRFYVTLNIESFENMEHQLLRLMWLTIVTGYTATLLLSVWIARNISRPVERFAQQVSALSPEKQDQSFSKSWPLAELNLINQALSQYQQRLSDYIHRERAFTENASHEFRTPLATLLSGIQLLQESPLTPAQQQQRARMQRAIEQMQHTTEALLYLARDDIEAIRQPCQLDELVQELCDSYRPAFEQKAVALTTELTPQVVSLPPGMAIAVVSNLLQNALRYTEQGGVHIRLGDGLLQVEDTGIGIDAEQLDSIFQRHFQGSSGRGQGVGLYLVEQICQRLGWRIEVTSSPGQGTCFSVHWPLNVKAGALTES